MMLTGLNPGFTRIPQLAFPKFVATPLNHTINLSPAFPAELLAITLSSLHKRLNPVDEGVPILFKPSSWPYRMEHVTLGHTPVPGPRIIIVAFYSVEDAVEEHSFIGRRGLHVPH